MPSVEASALPAANEEVRGDWLQLIKDVSYCGFVDASFRLGQVEKSLRGVLASCTLSTSVHTTTSVPGLGSYTWCPYWVFAQSGGCSWVCVVILVIAMPVSSMIVGDGVLTGRGCSTIISTSALQSISHCFGSTFSLCAWLIGSPYVSITLCFGGESKGRGSLDQWVRSELRPRRGEISVVVRPSRWIETTEYGASWC